MILYHGSPIVVNEPQFGVGNPITTMAWGFIVQKTLIWQLNGLVPNTRMGL